MNLRDFDAALIERFTSAIQGLPKYDTKDFTKTETLNLLLVREQMLFGIFADTAEIIGDAVREEATCFIGSCRIAPQVMDFFQQEVIDECIAAIEHAEAQADELYVMAAE